MHKKLDPHKQLSVVTTVQTQDKGNLSLVGWSISCLLLWVLTLFLSACAAMETPPLPIQVDTTDKDLNVRIGLPQVHYFPGRLLSYNAARTHAVIVEEKDLVLFDTNRAQEQQRFRGSDEDALFHVLSPDAKILALIYADGRVSLWDIATDRLQAVLAGHTDIINALNFSPNSERVVTASSDGIAQVWDVRSGELILRLRHPDKVSYATFSPNGALLATTTMGGSGQVFLWQLLEGTLLQSLPKKKLAFAFWTYVVCRLQP